MDQNKPEFSENNVGNSLLDSGNDTNVSSNNYVGINQATACRFAINPPVSNQYMHLVNTYQKPHIRPYYSDSGIIHSTPTPTQNSNQFPQPEILNRTISTQDESDVPMYKPRRKKAKRSSPKTRTTRAIAAFNHSFGQAEQSLQENGFYLKNEVNASIQYELMIFHVDAAIQRLQFLRSQLTQMKEENQRSNDDHSI